MRFSGPRHVPLSPRNMTSGRHSNYSRSRSSGQFDEPEPSESDEFRDQDPIVSEQQMDIEARTNLSHPIYHQPSETQLIRDSGLYYEEGVKERSFTRWRSLTQETRQKHDLMTVKAIDHDNGILVKQAFQTWHVTFLHKKSEAETERFFAQLERRAIKTRDMYLQGKAFTHWAQCTLDSREQAALAERHLTRFKYFHAWRELAEVNEAKVRQLGLRKFMRQWYQKLEYFRNCSDKALYVYQGNLVMGVYRQWYWAVCSQWAIHRQRSRTKHHAIVQWIESFRALQANMEKADSFRRKNTIKACLSQWSRKTRDVVSQQLEADQFRDKRLTADLTKAWRLQARYRPLADKIDGMVNWRVASTAFSTMVVQCRLQRQAVTVDEQRIVRNAWTEWNDRLRWQTLAHKIDDRLVTQMLYQWVLAERSALLGRLHDERLQKRVFRTWVDHWRGLKSGLKAPSTTIAEKGKRRVLKLALDQWRSRTEEKHGMAQKAHAFRVPRDIQEVLQIWRARTGECQKRNREAAGAAFYLSTTKTLTLWRNACKESKKQRQREAYADFRGRLKAKLARNILGIWRNNTAHVLELKDEANVYDQQRLLKFGTTLFDRWLLRLSDLRTRTLETTTQYERSLAASCLTTLVSRHRQIEQQRAQADALALRPVEKAAYESLRTLQLKIWDIQSLQSKADALRRNHERRHTRNLLFGLAQKALRQKGYVEEAIPQTARSRRAAPRPVVPVDSGEGTLIAVEDGGSRESGTVGTDVLGGAPAAIPAGGVLGQSTPSRGRAGKTGGLGTPRTTLGARLMTPVFGSVGRVPATEGRLRGARDVRRTLFEAIPEGRG